MRKVIFLDVDGVLNSNETLGLSWRECLEKPLLKLLYKIVAKTNAKIVLSSAWWVRV
jgi:histidinol phosphatase-like enzyme